MRERTVYVLRMDESVIPKKIAEDNSIKLVKIQEISFLVLLKSFAREKKVKPINVLVGYDFNFFRHLVNELSKISVQVLIHFLVHTPDEEQIVISQPTYSQSRFTAQLYPKTDEDWQKTFSNSQ